MAKSPFKAHRERILAEQAKAAARVSVNESPIEVQMKALLTATIRDLKTLASGEAKAKHKATVVGEFDDFIDGVMAADATDQILPTLMVWNIDAGNIDRAIEIGAHLLSVEDKTTPIGMAIEPAVALVKHISAMALKTPASISGDQLTALLDLVDQYNVDLFDDIGANLHKAMAAHLETEGQTEFALQHYERAFELNEKSGVKGKINALRKALETAEPAKDQAPPPSQQPSA